MSNPIGLRYEMYRGKAAFRATVLLAVAVIVVTVTDSAVEAASASQAEMIAERPAPTARIDTIGPTVEEARQMIVGTWIEDISDKIGVYEKGPKKRVFTEDGTLKRYRRTDAGIYELEETVQYALVDKNPRTGQKASDTKLFVAYLEIAESDGDIRYNVVNNVNREADPSYLSLQYIGGASATTVSFKPPSAFK